jgi:hypothetical protein
VYCGSPLRGRRIYSNTLVHVHTNVNHTWVLYYGKGTARENISGIHYGTHQTMTGRSHSQSHNPS